MKYTNGKQIIDIAKGAYHSHFRHLGYQPLETPSSASQVEEVKSQRTEEEEETIAEIEGANDGIGDELEELEEEFEDEDEEEETEDEEEKPQPKRNHRNHNQGRRR